MLEFTSSIEQLAVQLSFGPVFDKKVGEDKLVAVSGEHFGSCPMASDTVKFLADEPAFGINAFFPSFGKHQLDMNASGRRTKLGFFFIVGRIIVEMLWFGKGSEALIDSGNETSRLWFLLVFGCGLAFHSRFLSRLRMICFGQGALFEFVLGLGVALAFEPFSLSEEELHGFLF